MKNKLFLPNQALYFRILLTLNYSVDTLIYLFPGGGFKCR